MATSTAVGITPKIRGLKNRAVSKGNVVIPLKFPGMEKELKGFLNKIRDEDKARENQLLLPGFERILLDG